MVSILPLDFVLNPANAEDFLQKSPLVQLLDVVDKSLPDVDDGGVDVLLVLGPGDVLVSLLADVAEGGELAQVAVARAKRVGHYLREKQHHF